MKACFLARLTRHRAVPRTLSFRQHPAAQRLQEAVTVSARRRSQESADGMVSKEETVPTLSLCCVALLWATFGPVLRFIYAGEGLF